MIAEAEVPSPRARTRARTPLRRLTRNSVPSSEAVKDTSKKTKRDVLPHQTRSSTDNLPSSSLSSVSLLADTYDTLKKYYHRSAAVRIVGRTAERAAIQSFWRDALTGDGPRVLYICGNPGTGKTALIEEMLPELLEDGRIVTITKVNCMMHEDPRTSIDEISQAVRATKKSCRPTAGSGGGDRFQATLDCVEEHLRQQPARGINVIILDEVDQIASKDSALLERIFKLPYAPAVQLLIIGIANALDLSIRHISTPLEQVQVLKFAPYSVEDIVRILIARAELVAREGQVMNGEESENFPFSPINAPSVAGGSWQHLIAPVAIEMCARKVSSVSDLRKALEVMRDAISLAEKEAGTGALNESCAKDTNPSHFIRKFLPITLAHVTQAMDRIFGSAVRTASRHVQMIQDLNLHQKLLLATLYHLLRDSLESSGGSSNHGEGDNPSTTNGNGNGDVNPSPAALLKPTVQCLFDRYTVSARSNRIIDAVGRSEFNDLIANTESMGIIALIAPGKRRKDAGGAVLSDSRVLLSLPLEDVYAGLSTNPVLASLL